MPVEGDATVMKWTPEDLDKAAAVVLNKVDGLWWTYYDVDLSTSGKTLFEADARAVLDAIELRDRFYWRGTDMQRDALFPLLLQIFRDHPELALEVFRRIFDLNVVPDESGADRGLIGEMNRDERKARLDEYLDALRDRRCANRVILVAEGDSWFQFPGRRLSMFGLWRVHIDAVKDILDHLIAGKRYCVHSLAAAGDWLIQMLRADDYVEPLSQIEPDVFLFSGGGNDLLGEGRVGNMTLHKRRVEPLSDRHRQLLEARVAATAKRDTVFDRTMYEAGVVFLAKEFIGFLNLILLQYFVFFSNLAHSKLASMVIVTHGYDFAVPTRRSTARLVSLRRLVNRLMGSGKWLWLPLEQKRLNDDEKRAVVYAMITEFNELLVSLAESKSFPYLYHVDNRGIARSDKDWYDEIHLTSDAFRRSSSLFDVCIATALARPGASKKVFTIADLRDAGVGVVPA
jgi:hypothetical protein